MAGALLSSAAGQTAQIEVVSRRSPLRPELEKVDEFVCENNRDYRRFFNKE